MRVGSDQFAKTLRRNQTDAEKKLWDHLRNRELANFKFRRQHPIGSYIADFYCAEKKPLIELDGGQHLIQTKKDEKRTQAINQMGCQVLRFWDHEVLQDIDTVLEAILLHLNDPHPNPLPKREREEKS